MILDVMDNTENKRLLERDLVGLWRNEAHRSEVKK